MANKTFIEYDGGILASLENGQKATLTCSGKMMKTDIVVTASEGSDEEWFNDGKTHLWIEIAAEGRMSPTLYFTQGVANGVAVNWGDGSELQTSNYQGSIGLEHTYKNIGTYIITLNVDEGCYLSFSTGVLGAYGSDNASIYRNMLKKIEIGDDARYIGSNVFRSHFSLTKVKMSDDIASISDYSFSHCSSLSSIKMPDGLANISKGAFQYCPSLASVIIPSSVTSIGSNAFNCCYGMKFYDFTKHTAIPTLESASAFSAIRSDCEIRVPMALVEEWKAATNWSTNASKIVGV